MTTLLVMIQSHHYILVTPIPGTRAHEMEPDFWHERWAADKIGFHQDEANSYLKKYWQTLGLASGSRILVPLCGKSLDMLWLVQQGHRVVGIEISQLAVEAFFSENGLSPSITSGAGYSCWSGAGIELYCGDFFSLDTGVTGNVDGFFDRAALVAMPQPKRSAYVTQLTRLLSAQASGLLVTMDYNPREMDGPPFAVPAGEVESLYAGDYLVEHLHEADVLDLNPAFRERGLGQLTEHVFRLMRK